MSKVAIVICNYNDSRFLIDLVRRMAKQSPDELIVVDDHSTDRSFLLLENLKSIYPIKIVHNTVAPGPFRTFVAGCQSTDADYISCWSADDFPNPYYLSAMHEAIKNYPLVDLYTCNARVFREDMEFERILFPFDAYISPDYAVKMFRAGYAKMINLCGVLMKRELVLKCWEEGGKYTDVNFDCMFTFFSIFSKGFVNLAGKYATYRSYPVSFGAKGKNKQISQAIRIHQEMYKCYPEVYDRAIASGIWGAKAKWSSLVALWGIMKMPRWARKRFYEWFYQYDGRIEKL